MTLREGLAGVPLRLQTRPTGLSPGWMQRSLRCHATAWSKQQTPVAGSTTWRRGNRVCRQIRGCRWFCSGQPLW